MLIPIGILAGQGISYSGGVAGYVIGGTNGGNTLNYTDKMAYATETMTNFSSITVQQPAAHSNSGVAGYAYSSGDLGTGVGKITYSNDSVSYLGTGVSTQRVNASGLSNKGVAGYFLESQQLSDKFSYPGDARTALNLKIFMNNWAQKGSFSNQGVAGYLGGGANARTNTEKVDFATDTSLGALTSLSSGRIMASSCFANNGVAGYFAGGVDGNNNTGYTLVEKFAFPSDTKTTLGTGLSYDHRVGAGMANSGFAGYVCGGTYGAGSNGIDRIAFPSDTRTVMAITLGLARLQITAMGNEAI